MYGLFINWTNIGKWNPSARWINDLCSEGRIPGAVKIGSYWAIPEDAKRPKDARIKSGRYCKGTITKDSFGDRL